MIRWVLVALCACGRIDYEALSPLDAGRAEDAPHDARSTGDAPMADAPSADAPSDDGGRDAAVPCTSFGPWSTPEVLPELAGGTIEYDPAQRGDRLQIWFVDQSVMSIQTARRASVLEPYGPPTEEVVNGDPGGDQDPAPTGDGLALLWASNRTGTYRIYEATRARADLEFGPAALAAGLETYTSNSLDVTPDGLIIYLNLFGELQRAVRADRSAPFGAPEPVGVAAAFPTFSRDELELYYVPIDDTILRVRASRSEPFGPEMAIPGFCSACGDPDLLADGTELIVIDRFGNVSRSVRSCD